MALRAVVVEDLFIQKGRHLISVEILRYPPGFKLGHPTPAPLATLPMGPENRDLVAGLAVDDGYNVYAGPFAVMDPDHNGIWRTPDGRATLFASMPEGTLS